MLITDFYRLKDIQQTDEGSYEALICLNQKHPIYKGHFPGRPVVPGVCMLQIFKELTEEVTGKHLSMDSSGNIKFVALINPDKNPNLKIIFLLKREEELLKVNNLCYFEDILALKTNIKYKY